MNSDGGRLERTAIVALTGSHDPASNAGSYYLDIDNGLGESTPTHDPEQTRRDNRARGEPGGQAHYGKTSAGNTAREASTPSRDYPRSRDSMPAAARRGAA
eukprot:951421-Prymnesium_polylepis.1